MRQLIALSVMVAFVSSAMAAPFEVPVEQSREKKKTRSRITATPIHGARTTGRLALRFLNEEGATVKSLLLNVFPSSLETAPRSRPTPFRSDTVTRWGTGKWRFQSVPTKLRPYVGEAVVAIQEKGLNTLVLQVDELPMKPLRVRVVGPDGKPISNVEVVAHIEGLPSFMQFPITRDDGMGKLSLVKGRAAVIRIRPQYGVRYIGRRLNLAPEDVAALPETMTVELEPLVAKAHVQVFLREGDARTPVTQDPKLAKKDVFPYVKYERLRDGAIVGRHMAIVKEGRAVFWGLKPGTYAITGLQIPRLKQGRRESLSYSLDEARVFKISEGADEALTLAPLVFDKSDLKQK